MNRIRMDFDRLKRLTKEALGDTITEPIPARLGKSVAIAGQDNIFVPIGISGSPGWVYIHGNGDSDADGDVQGESMALNGGKLRREDMTYNAFILVKKRKDGAWEVVGLDAQAQAEYAYKMTLHPQTSTVLSQFDNGLLQPTQPPSMRAGVGYGTYRYLGTVSRIISQMTKDFSADIPGSAGQAVAVAIEINPIDGTFYYTNGSAFDASKTLQEAFDGGHLPQPSKALFVGWVKLINGMTAIQHMTHIIAAHEVMTVDRIPIALSHAIIIGSNQQYVAHRCSVESGGSIEVGGTGILYFT